jgi:thiamine biosynthesis lipoprotein
MLHLTISVVKNCVNIILNPFGASQRDFYLLVIGVFLLSGCNQELKKTKAEDFKIELTGEAQGTTYSIAYYDIKERNLKSQVDSILDRIDQSISTYRKGSVINRWNKSINGSKIDAQFLELILESWTIYTATDGAFDPTVKPLVSYWGFGPEKFENTGVNHEDSEIWELKSLVGLDTLKVMIDSDTLRFSEIANSEIRWDSVFLFKPDSRMALDFNAVGQGSSVDKVAEFLVSLDIKVFFVEIGGEIVAGRPKPNGELWRFGIDKPESDLDKREMQAIANLRNRALATSGSYRKFYEREGVKYSHTIDPSTGKPVTHTLLSATVFSSTAAEADAMATAFMVFGKDSTLSFLAQNDYLGDYVYLIYDSAGVLKTYKSPQIEAIIDEK